MHAPITAITFTGGITREGRRVRIYVLGGEFSPVLTVGARYATLYVREHRDDPFGSAANGPNRGPVTAPRDAIAGIAALVEGRRKAERNWHGFEKRRIAERSAPIFHRAPGGPWRETASAHEEGTDQEVAPAAPHDDPEGWRHAADLVRTGERGFAGKRLLVGAVHEGPAQLRVTMTRVTVRVAIGRHAVELNPREADALRAALAYEARRKTATLRSA